jgi:NADH-ubiquinone/plastoquinone oxidoreductase subunit 3
VPLPQKVRDNENRCHEHNDEDEIKLGWPGYWAVVLFVATLAAALLYVWRVGALDWTRKTFGSGGLENRRDTKRLLQHRQKTVA